VSTSRKKPRWYQFTLRRLIAVQLLVILCWWLAGSWHVSTGRNLRGVWLHPRLHSIHGVWQIGAYESRGDWCLCFWTDNRAPAALAWDADGTLIMQKHGGAQRRW
jgi:hypothetical protein